MTRRTVPMLLVLAVLVGCSGDGGGDDDGESGKATPSATTRPDPTPDPAVAARAAVADRIAAMRGELHDLRALRPRGVQNLYYKLDGLALELGTRHLRVDTRRFDRLDKKGFTSSGLIRGYEALVQRLQRQEWTTLVPVWRRYAAKLARLRVRGALARSTRAFQLDEWRRSIAVMREFLGYLRREPPSSTHDSFYQPRAYGQYARWPVVIAVPYNQRKQLIGGLQRDIRRLQGAERLAPRSPSVGDVYRRAIAGSFVSPLREFKRREAVVAAQLWMLSRISELEDTPRDVYETARNTVALQGHVDARNPYARLRDIGLALIELLIFDKRDLVQARRDRTWALELLARPVPPLLERTRDRIVALYEHIDLSAPPSDDPFALQERSKPLDRAQRHMERILRQGARLVDSPRTLRRATTKALRATRPTP